MVREIIFVLSKMRADGRIEGFSYVCELTFYDDNFSSTGMRTISSMVSDFSESFPELKKGTVLFTLYSLVIFVYSSFVLT